MKTRTIHLILLVALATGACASQPSTSTGARAGRAHDSSPSRSDRGAGRVTVDVWFIQNESLFVVPRSAAATVAVGRLAVERLLAGPRAGERAADVSTAVPEGTELLGLGVSDGTARVDLSDEFEAPGGTFGETMRLNQLTCTLTQFPTVRRVILKIEGSRVRSFASHGIVLDRPLTRRDCRRALPPIVVEAPGIGDRVSSPVTISGTADVFEATVTMRILDEDNRELVRTFTTATCGTGCRGDYLARVDFDVDRRQAGVVEVFAESAEDGSPMFTVRVPVTLVP